MKYSVTYGVNNSHLTECKLFDLYRESREFFYGLEYPSAVLSKLHYDANGYVQNRETKLFKSEKGRDNTAFLESLR